MGRRVSSLVQRRPAHGSDIVEAWALVYQQCWEQSVRMAMRQGVGDRQLAEDVASDAFLRVSLRYPELPTGEACRVWLAAVRNAVVDARRSPSQRRWEAMSAEAYVAPETADDLVACAIAVASLDQICSDWSQRVRQVFVRVHVRGWSSSKTADALGVSEKTVINALSIIRSTVRRATVAVTRVDEVV
jgi:RNA polymerase sigma factor (sigma-70 family)